MRRTLPVRFPRRHAWALGAVHDMCEPKPPELRYCMLQNDYLDQNYWERLDQEVAIHANEFKWKGFKTIGEVEFVDRVQA